MFVLFFWVLNLAKSYFSGLANFLAIFLGFAKFPLFFGSDKFPAIVGSSNFCITHLSPLNEEHTVLKKKQHKIIVAFHIYSNFDKHCIILFFGFKFRVILGRASLSKKCLCAPPPGG